MQRHNALMWRPQAPYGMKATDHSTYSKEQLPLQKGTHSVL